MTVTEPEPDVEISILAVATTLLRNRRRIIRWMVLGAVIAVAPVLNQRPVYTATTTFIPQGGDAGQPGISSLASQFGIGGIANLSQSSDFYSRLLRSRALLSSIVNDTFPVQEMGGRRVAFVKLFDIDGESARRREEQGVQLLTAIAASNVIRSTGEVQLTVTTPWPSVSLAIAKALVNGVNSFNQKTRQSQAREERKFVEARLSTARDNLNLAEERLIRFLQANKQVGSSPELNLEREQFQSEISMQQQVVTSLAQSYEEVRTREVRDTPLITVIEPPSVPTVPASRGRAKRGLTGLLVGAVIGVFLVLISKSLSRLRKDGDSDADEFFGALDDVKQGIPAGIRRLWQRVRRRNIRGTGG